MSSRRLVRVSESIRGVLARLVSRERTLEGTLITITGVDVSPDLRHATVFVSHLDGRTLHFKFDEAQKRGDRILQIMSELEPPAEEKP
jgi:ribosome-binding factor A